MLNIHGFSDEAEPMEPQYIESQTQPVKPTQSGIMFRDPSEYEHMSQEERKELTKQMMGAHKQWASGTKQMGS